MWQHANGHFESWKLSPGFVLLAEVCPWFLVNELLDGGGVMENSDKEKKFYKIDTRLERPTKAWKSKHGCK